MRQDQIVSDLALLGIQGCQDSDQALYMATSLELWISGYGIGDHQDQSQDYEDTLGRRRIQILEIYAGESFGCS